MSEDCKQKILAIPGKDGFYKSGTEQTFIHTAESLIRDHGFTEKEVIDFLDNMYRTVSDEYGN